MAPERIVDTECLMGEHPVWDDGLNVLYRCDMLSGTIYAYAPATNSVETVFDGPNVGGYTIQADGSLLLFMEDGSLRAWPRDGNMLALDGIPDDSNAWFHDCVPDSRGRVLCGTLPTNDSSSHLYRLDVGGTFERLVSDCGLANGAAFGPDGETLYFTDTEAGEIYRFRYDPAMGELHDREVFAIPEGSGVPDGLTVDEEGTVWSAMLDGWRVVRYANDGKQLADIELPAKKVTSVGFGGPDYEKLFVTTGGGEDRDENGAGAGALFAIEPGVSGVPSNRSAIAW